MDDNIVFVRTDIGHVYIGIIIDEGESIYVDRPRIPAYHIRPIQSNMRSTWVAKSNVFSSAEGAFAYKELS